MRAGIANTPNLASYSSTKQTVTLPKTITNAYLHFWLYPMSSEPALMSLPADPLGMVEKNAAAAGDAQMVLILDSSGGIVERLHYDRHNDRKWLEYSIDLSHYADKTIQVYFGVYNNGTNGVTGMYVDDVSLNACSATTPTSTPSSAPTATPTSMPTATPTSMPTATPTAAPTQTPLPNVPSIFFVPLISNDHPLGITGQIVDARGQGLGGVIIITDKGQSTISEPGGFYALNDLDTGVYIIRPEKGSTIFLPQTREITLPPSAFLQDFAAVPPTPTPDPYP
jgi:hypothetical protein